MSHYSVHTPIQAIKADSEKYRKRFDETGIANKIKTRPEKNAITRITQNNPEYAAMVESVDRSVGRVMRKLNELDLLKKTIIIFTSDNGGLSTLQKNLRVGPASCLPLRAGKGWLYEGGIRVPTIISWPGRVIPGSVSDIPITTCDVYPTLLNVAGLESNPKQHLDLSLIHI